MKNHNKTNKRYKPKQYELNEEFYFRGNNYLVDDKLVYYKLTHNELEFADWLSNRIDKEITMIPNIDINGGVSAPDYMINGKSYDLKTLSSNSKDKQPIYHNIYKKEKQSHNFFIDASTSQYSFEVLCEEAQQLFYRPDISWVEIIGIKKEDKFTIYSRK